MRGRLDYDWYLGTDHWRNLRAKKLEDVEYQCERCGEFARRNVRRGWSLLQVHHRTYERMPFRERLEDLEVLCAACHAAEHGRPVPDRDELRQRLSSSIVRQTTGLISDDIDLEVQAWDELVSATDRGFS